MIDHFSVNDKNSFSVNDSDSLLVNNDDLLSIIIEVFLQWRIAVLLLWMMRVFLQWMTAVFLHYLIKFFFVIKYRVRVIVNIDIIVCLKSYNIFTLEEQYIQWHWYDNLILTCISNAHATKS